MSFSFDVKCFFKTIVAVLKREGMVEGTAGQSKNKEETHQTDERQLNFAKVFYYDDIYSEIFFVFLSTENISNI